MNRSEAATDIYVETGGRMYGTWVRTPHYEGERITHPAGLLESALKDEKHAERDLKADANFVVDYIELPDAKYSTDDFYNGCIVTNLTQGWVDTCTDFIGSTKRFELSTTRTTATGDDIILTNIDCNINTTTFDAFEAARSGWKFDGTLTEKVDIDQWFDELLKESHAIMPKSYNTYKLIPLDTGTAIATFGQPLAVKVKGGGEKYLIDVNLTSLLDLYSDFRIEYAYDYARGKYTGEVYINKNGSSSATNLGSAYQTKCGNCETNYKVKRKFEYQCKWISDQTTAEYLTQKWVNWFTSQRLIVEGYWDTNAYLKYEIGDLVKLNFDKAIPASKNNSTVFMITGKEPYPVKQNSRTWFKFVEMPA